MNKRPRIHKSLFDYKLENKLISGGSDLVKMRSLAAFGLANEKRCFFRESSNRGLSHLSMIWALFSLSDGGVSSSDYLNVNLKRGSNEP